MKTWHTFHNLDSADMAAVNDESIDLVVTSPPYPMIEMWDEAFGGRHPAVKKALAKGAAVEAFELMHRSLDPVWTEVYRVLKPGGFACINIGDATRTVRGSFALYPNHMRILEKTLSIGFSTLPCIVWRKQTNAPNKFMGSGMLPAGAYVTLEHEYILILRKGPKREFIRPADKNRRRGSALFWEERNTWFSDVWFDIKGTGQTLGDKNMRARSGAYPFELAYRLVNMYSVKEDTVLDPFSGTGTTTAAALASGRNSIGCEIDTGFDAAPAEIKAQLPSLARRVIRERLAAHVTFVGNGLAAGQPFKHVNQPYGFPVKTAQETNLLLNDVTAVTQPAPAVLEAKYDDTPQPEFCRDWAAELEKENPAAVRDRIPAAGPGKGPKQRSLFNEQNEIPD